MPPLPEDIVTFTIPDEAEDKQLAAAAVCGLVLTLYKDLFEVRTVFLLY